METMLVETDKEGIYAEYCDDCRWVIVKYDDVHGKTCKIVVPMETFANMKDGDRLEVTHDAEESVKTRDEVIAERRAVGC